MREFSEKSGDNSQSSQTNDGMRKRFERKRKISNSLNGNKEKFEDLLKNLGENQFTQKYQKYYQKLRVLYSDCFQSNNLHVDESRLVDVNGLLLNLHDHLKKEIKKIWGEEELRGLEFNGMLTDIIYQRRELQDDLRNLSENLSNYSKELNKNKARNDNTGSVSIASNEIKAIKKEISGSLSTYKEKFENLISKLRDDKGDEDEKKELAKKYEEYYNKLQADNSEPSQSNYVNQSKQLLKMHSSVLELYKKLKRDIEINWGEEKLEYLIDSDIFRRTMDKKLGMSSKLKRHTTNFEQLIQSLGANKQEKQGIVEKYEQDYQRLQKSYSDCIQGDPLHIDEDRLREAANHMENLHNALSREISNKYEKIKIEENTLLDLMRRQAEEIEALRAQLVDKDQEIAELKLEVQHQKTKSDLYQRQLNLNQSIIEDYSQDKD